MQFSPPQSTAGRASIVGPGLLASLLMVSYEMARPATESLFLEVHTSRWLPAAWLLVAASVIAAVALYNRHVVRHGLLHLYSAVCAISALLLILILMACRAKVPASYLLLYVWKDVYVIVLMEIFYSYADAAFPISTARWVFGLFGMLASLGGIIGSQSSRLISARLGTSAVLWLVSPLLLLIAGLALLWARRVDVRPPAERLLEGTGLAAGLRVLRASNYLALLLTLIFLVQVVITLIDYEFNGVVEHAFPATNYRTGIIANTYSMVSVSTVALHGLTGPVLRLAGAPLTLLSIPVLLGAGLTGFLIRPRFKMMALVKVASKALDYSLFRAAKELLYIPLSYAEKTVGKSLIDMAAYRLGKAGASLLLAALIALQGDRFVTPLALTLLLFWLGITRAIARRFRATVSRVQELQRS